MSRRTTFDHTPDGLRRRLADLERGVADLHRRGNAVVSYAGESERREGKTAFMRRSTNQSVPHNAGSVYPSGYTRLDFDVVERDDLGIADLTNNRFVIQEPGLYLVTANVSWVGASAAGNRSIIIGLNGATLTASSVVPLGSGWTTNHSIVTTSDLEPGDIVVLDVIQNSGGSLDLEASGIQPHMTATLLI